MVKGEDLCFKVHSIKSDTRMVVMEPIFQVSLECDHSGLVESLCDIRMGFRADGEHLYTPPYCVGARSLSTRLRLPEVGRTHAGRTIENNRCHTRPCCLVAG